MSVPLTRPRALSRAEAPAGAVPFSSRGLMAPGIRLFQNLGFPAKAAVVSLAFLVPLLLLAFSFWSVSMESIAFSATERVGVQYGRALMPLLDAAQNRRRAATAQAADLGEAQARVEQAWNALAAVNETLGAELRTRERWTLLLQQHLALKEQQVLDTPDATFGAHTRFVAQVLELLKDVADASNLTLDPDIDTYYLMRAGVEVQPQLVEGLGRMRGMGNAAIRSASLGSAQRDQVASALAFALMWEQELKASLARAQRADAAIADETRLDQALSTNEAFLERVREQVLGDTPRGDAAAFVALANQAIAAHYAGIDRILAALDLRLERRVDRLRQAMVVKLGIAAAGVAVAIYFLVAFYRVTQGGISEVARQLQQLSQGNLSLQPRAWGRDEVAQLMGTLAATLEALRRTVSQVRAGSGEINTASEEVAAASMDLSRRTEQSAAHLQRTAAAMTQIGRTVRQTATTAAGAADMVAHNAEVAAQGSQVVGDVVHTMAGIRDASGRIAEIIATIDGIAFQTNILALNAAVEAARAGEAGRGFAVVASEVRALAQRSGAAAREIKDLIAASVNQVENGSRIVAQAGDTMAEIVSSAERVRTLIEEISQGTGEQTAGLGEIGQAIGELDAMTQQNAALVEQTAAAAASLSTNAQRLSGEMAFFRLA
ncbi:methyl-accepting chemotaxis protein [Azohydromonas australica]|uniref:methyl-accepting chemotaxis protein n=1 Tax=Azohydromonas australica TaxID=364039 RepID=UPI000424740A|nr:methyl-accepting chemotaxis protein [Azohydromonas australica]